MNWLRRILLRAHRITGVPVRVEHVDTAAQFWTEFDHMFQDIFPKEKRMGCDCHKKEAAVEKAVGHTTNYNVSSGRPQDFGPATGTAAWAKQIQEAVKAPTEPARKLIFGSDIKMAARYLRDAGNTLQVERLCQIARFLEDIEQERLAHGLTPMAREIVKLTNALAEKTAEAERAAVNYSESLEYQILLKKEVDAHKGALTAKGLVIEHYQAVSDRHIDRTLLMEKEVVALTAINQSHLKDIAYLQQRIGKLEEAAVTAVVALERA